MQVQFNNSLRFPITLIVILMVGQCLGLTGTASALDDFTIESAGHFGGRVVCSALQGDYAYLGQGGYLHIIDVSGVEFQKIGYLQLLGVPIDIVVSGNYAYIYISNDGGLQVIDISDPQEPACLA